MNYLQALVSDPAAWIALLTLIAMEVVGCAITHFTPTNACSAVQCKAP